MLDNLDEVTAHKGVTLKGFYIFDSPVVNPLIYKALPTLTSIFEDVYIHDTHGDGYSLEGVDQSKLRKVFQPRK